MRTLILASSFCLLASTALAQFDDFTTLATVRRVVSSSPASPTPDILWWKCNDGSGTTVTADVGPNGTTDCSWVTGKSGSGYAISGNGSSQYAYTASTVSFNTNIVTVCAWVKVTATPGSIAALWDTADFSATANVFALYFNGNTYYGFRRTSGAMWWYTSGIVAAEGTWTHVMVVYDGSSNLTATLYVNGELKSKVAVEDGATGSDAFATRTLGALASNDGEYPLNAAIDDWRVYSGNQSASVTNIMNDPK